MAINFNKAEFVLSSVKAETFIRDGRPQVTFAGRSNVGKSSVINRLLGRKNFARVGATPGKTSQINYFRIDDKIYFTDLPGYGYAKVSKEERDRWGRLMERYFAGEGLITLGVIEPNLALIRQTLTLPEEALLIPFSAEKGTGKTELLAAISALCGIKTSD